LLIWIGKIQLVMMEQMKNVGLVIVTKRRGFDCWRLKAGTYAISLPIPIINQRRLD